MNVLSNILLALELICSNNMLSGYAIVSCSFQVIAQGNPVLAFNFRLLFGLCIDGRVCTQNSISEMI